MASGPFKNLPVIIGLLCSIRRVSTHFNCSNKNKGNSIMSVKIKSLVLKSLVVPVLLASAATYANSESRFKDGEQVYAKVCGHCHETAGDIGPVLSGRNLPAAYT